MTARRRFRPGVAALATALAGFVSQPAASQGRDSASPAASGERLYMRGLAASDSAVAATVEGDIRVQSTAMPCVGCHRRSGMGGAEGPLVVPPVVGSLLFSPVTRGAAQLGPPRATGPGTRPAYDAESLLRAVRDGVAASGRPLSATMPRYAIDPEDGRALFEFLRGLGAAKPAGVEEATVRLATIVTSDVAASDRDSMLAVLRAFVRAKNGGTRYEARRRTSGGWDMRQQYQGYRDWLLDEWELSGPPATWEAQLEELYGKQPVYAVVGGITNAGWSVVDAFCARHGLPSVLPQTPLPRASADEDGFYSLHFSRGVISEARAIARHVQESGSVVRQVSRCGDVGEAAARELAGALPAGSAAGECLPAPLPLGAASWPALVGKAKSLVIWLDARDRAALEALATSPALDGVAQVYLSASLLGEDAVRLPAALASRTVLATPFVPPDELDRHAARSLVWMKASGIEAPSRRVAVNALFAAVLASDALAMPGVLGSREYFVETIEHMAGRSLNPTAYPSLSFAPGRRFGFEGASLLKPPASPGQPFAKVQEWSAPRS